MKCNKMFSDLDVIYALICASTKALYIFTFGQIQRFNSISCKQRLLNMYKLLFMNFEEL